MRGGILNAHKSLLANKVYAISPERLSLRPGCRRSASGAVVCAARRSKTQSVQPTNSGEVVGGLNQNLQPWKFAVIGGGLAGVAVAHQLMSNGVKSRPVQLHLYDAYGLAAGASGAAAGLLHPYSRKGKMMWEGEAAMEAALRLVAVARNATKGKEDVKPFFWCKGLLRLPRNSKELQDTHTLQEALEHDASKSAPDKIACIPLEEIQRLVPGTGDFYKKGEAQDVGETDLTGILIKEGCVLHPERYVSAVWAACKDLAETWEGTSEAVFLRQKVESLAALDTENGPYHAIIVAAGAATATIDELKTVVSMRLAQGYTVDMIPPENKQNDLTYPEHSPSFVGSTYIAAHGVENLVVGATKEYGLTPEQAFGDLSREEVSLEECEGSLTKLFSEAGKLWEPLAEWKVERIRSGVRALPQRTRKGEMPLAGKVSREGLLAKCWLATGLGSRGVLYHAWLAKIVGQAVLNDDEHLLPDELLRWKRQN